MPNTHKPFTAQELSDIERTGSLREVTAERLVATVKDLQGHICETCDHWQGPRDEAERKANAVEYGGDGTGPYECDGLDEGGNEVESAWTVAGFGCGNWRLAKPEGTADA